MSAAHTPGLMKHEALMGSITVVNRDEAIFHCGLGLRHGNYGDEQVQNARRLVACWNSFNGVPTEMIELVDEIGKCTMPYRLLQVERNELLAALKAMLTDFEGVYADGEPAVINARAAVAKATGGAA